MVTLERVWRAVEPLCWGIRPNNRAIKSLEEFVRAAEDGALSISVQEARKTEQQLSFSEAYE